MKIEDIVSYLSHARIIDLSKKALPGKAEGPLDTGKRKYEIRPFSFPPGETRCITSKWRVIFLPISKPPPISFRYVTEEEEKM